MKDTLLFAGFVENEWFTADGKSKIVRTAKNLEAKRIYEAQMQEKQNTYGAFDFVINKNKLVGNFLVSEICCGTDRCVIESYKTLRGAEKCIARLNPNAKILYENF